VGWSVFPQGLQIFDQEKKTFAHAFVLLASFLYLSVLHEILKFVVSAQTQHASPTNRWPTPERTPAACGATYHAST
jgi:mannose/cellobiose epimerase-like protein (N-acyl-D-glucosamine 2-epimerase family)